MEAHTLRLLPIPLAVCQLPTDSDAAPSLAAFGEEFAALIRTDDELTVVCPETQAPPGAKVETGWRAFKVEAQFALTTVVGVVAALSEPIAAAGISVFVISTWQTDYLLVQADRVKAASAALEAAGHNVITDRQ